jgi:putative flavoprotein involved in K+ transport
MGASAGRVRVAVIGGGQAGLAVSHELTARDVEHVVLERLRIGQTWRDRWDSFCLVTPNWTVQLPGGAYTSDDPDGYLRRDDIVRHLETYAASFEAPVREGVEVTALRQADGCFAVETSTGVLNVEQVVVCSGAYQRPHRPAAAASVPAGLPAIDAESYCNPSTLPPGRVLVVGSGQTGCQISEERPRQDARSSSPAVGRRGARAASTGAMSCVGSSTAGTWTRCPHRCRRRLRDSSPTFRPPATAGATTSTSASFRASG